MTEKQEFKMPENLEGIVKGALFAGELRKQSHIEVDMDLRNNARRLYGAMTSHGLTSVDLEQLKVAAPHVVESMLTDGEGEIYTRLKISLNDDTFNGARAFYMGKLDEDHKAQFYLDMVQKGLVPSKLDDNASDKEKENHKMLKNLQGELALAEAIETAVRRGKYDRAEALVSEHLKAETASLNETYRGLNATGARGRLYNDIALIRRMIAANLMKENKLYGLVDKAIENNDRGKAYALAGMYKAYSQQLEIEKRRAESEKAA